DLPSVVAHVKEQIAALPISGKETPSAELVGFMRLLREFTQRPSGVRITQTNEISALCKVITRISEHDMNAAQSLFFDLLDSISTIDDFSDRADALSLLFEKLEKSTLGLRALLTPIIEKGLDLADAFPNPNLTDLVVVRAIRIFCDLADFLSARRALIRLKD